MYKINLNCDLGEGAKYDELIIPMINSANIACGFHAGDSDMMMKTIDICRKNGVGIGAHPGYPDRENFGRTNMNVTPRQVYGYTLYQLGALTSLADAAGAKVSYVKPHGAMYNMAAKDYELAKAIADAIRDFDSSLIFLGLSGSQMIKAASDNGMRYACEVFADRAYEADGTLRPRSLEGSMITDEDQAIARVIRMVKEGKVKAYTGEDIDIEAHSVCVHGDGEKALDFVRALNKAFADNSVKTFSISEVID